MGLFGGFKAKFTRDTVAKTASKNAKKEEVICTSYRVYSEFDEVPQSSQPEYKVRKRPSEIKTVLSKTNNESNHSNASTSTPLETMIVTNPKVKKSKKKPATPPIKMSSTINSPYDNNINSSKENISEKQLTSTNNSDEQTIELRPNRAANSPKSAPSSIYVIGKTSSFNPALNSPENSKEVPPKSILKSKSSTELSESSNHISQAHSEVNSPSTLNKAKKVHKSATKVTTYVGEILTALHTPEEINSNLQSKSLLGSLKNTSNIAATLFFGEDADFDDDVEIDSEKPDRREKNQNSAEC